MEDYPETFENYSSIKEDLNNLALSDFLQNKNKEKGLRIQNGISYNYDILCFLKGKYYDYEVHYEFK